MNACSRCGKDVEARFRFCPWCGAAARSKLVEFFRPHPNSRGRALRVSRYLGDDPQVRFSVWDDGIARAAVSLDEEESRRLAAFLAAGAHPTRLAAKLRDVAKSLGVCPRRTCPGVRHSGVSVSG